MSNTYGQEIKNFMQNDSEANNKISDMPKEVNVYENTRSLESSKNIELNFNLVINILRKELDYVVDGSFNWNNVVGLLVVPLSETDSKNKVRGASHSTNIQLTDSILTKPGRSKTEDFFPSLIVNETFSKWRLAVNARMSKKNIAKLKGIDVGNGWINDKIEIKRRTNLNGGQNPVIHICYLDNLDPIRAELWPNDYLILVKQKNKTTYEAFGLKSDIVLVNNKTLYIAENSKNDQTTFMLNELLAEPRIFIRIFDKILNQKELIFNINENDPQYEVADEIWVLDEISKQVTHRLEVENVDNEARIVNFKIKNELEYPVSLEKLKEYGLSNELERSILELIDNLDASS
ncbi:hypothetical protein ACVNRM_12120 [Bacillus paranthracis]|uniref:hypothetical protein n=1 Tax=Bacillus TaxID=1386 RepID=UPI000278FB5D|nr:MULTISPECIES: hypothetical protein [Bacillus]EJQ10855.1 hypothetical protein IC5_00100 [Bacillus cereus AND1407]KFL80774.1 hypothetical protein DJ51_1738 [Bacillus cereus]MRA62604.1 hypothetical protein [Bacillus thuringiensis]OUB96364.1 hypothetical protein BK752_16515 [Bacillus thuringiensis serovar canadensis]KAB7638269.1 hypothetical protein GBN96_11530 [Bacillus sp. B4-WWTP-NA-D-NA-NA]